MKGVRSKAKGVIIRKVRRGIWLFCLVMSAVVTGLLVTTDAVGQTCTEPPLDMVSWYPGDGNANDIQDSNAGTLQNGATFATGIVGQAFSFDGIDDFVRVSHNANLNPGSADFTIDFWMRTTSSVVAILNKRPVCAHSSFWGVRFAANTCIELDQDAAGTNYNPVCSTIPVNDGSWHHMAFVRQSVTATLYIDGAVRGSGSTSGVTNIVNTADLLFGNDPCVQFGDGTQFYQGELDEIQYFNRALTQTEIQGIFQAGSAGQCRTCAPPPPDMISWWPGDGNAFDIQDGNDGTLQNGAGFAAGMVGQAFSLDGVNDHVSIGNPTNLQLQDFTIDAWIKLNTLFFGGQDPAIVEYGHGGYGFGIARDAGIATVPPIGPHEIFLTKVGVDAVSAGLVILDTNWHHVAVTKSGGTVTFYLDGVGATAPVSYNPGFSFTTNVAIGFNEEFLANAFPGLIDDVEIFNRALSAAEIQAIVMADSAGKCKFPMEELTSLSPAMLWIGLKNSDDQGTQFDLRTEVYISDTLVAEGETRCITGVTRNPSKAKEVSVEFGPISDGVFASGDGLALRVLTRIGTNPDDTKCSGPGGSHNNAVGLRLYYDALSRPSRFGAEITPDPLMDFFLHSIGTDFFLDDTPPTATSAKFKDSSAVNFAGGNPWKEIGIWSMPLP